MEPMRLPNAFCFAALVAAVGCSRHGIVGRWSEESSLGTAETTFKPDGTYSFEVNVGEGKTLGEGTYTFDGKNAILRQTDSSFMFRGRVTKGGPDKPEKAILEGDSLIIHDSRNPHHSERWHRG